MHVLVLFSGSFSFSGEAPAARRSLPQSLSLWQHRAYAGLPRSIIAGSRSPVIDIASRVPLMPSEVEDPLHLPSLPWHDDTQSAEHVFSVFLSSCHGKGAWLACGKLILKCLLSFLFNVQYYSPEFRFDLHSGIYLRGLLY